AGFAPEVLDIAVDPFDPAKVARARFVAISVPMHTALRLGVKVAENVRALNPEAAVCFYGLYAALNADYLLEHGADYCIGGYVEGSRGCLHLCTHCPIPPVYGGRFFIIPEEVVLEDVRRQVRAGATHLTFGDPDFLNGPGHALSVVRAIHAEFPELTFDITT